MSGKFTWSVSARRRLRRAAERIGTRGLVGIALAAAAAAMFAAAPPLADEAQRLQAESERLRGEVERQRKQHAGQPPASEQALRLRQWFPTLDRASGDLRRVFDAAQNNRLELARGDYTLARADDSARLRRLEVVLPVRNDYATIKRFVAEVLNAVPHASLADLRIERSAANVDQLDARVHFTLFYREP
jgi:hypothetical protein